MPFSRFDVVLVSFPFTERQRQKQRPAVVLSSRKFNDTHNQIIGAMVTTATNTSWPSDCGISDLKAAGLTRPSVMRLKIFSVVDDLILGRLGTLAEADRYAAAAAIEAVFVK